MTWPMIFTFRETCPELFRSNKKGPKKIKIKNAFSTAKCHVLPLMPCNAVCNKSNFVGPLDKQWVQVGEADYETVWQVDERQNTVLDILLRWQRHVFRLCWATLWPVNHSTTSELEEWHDSSLRLKSLLLSTKTVGQKSADEWTVPPTTFFQQISLEKDRK